MSRYLYFTVFSSGMTTLAIEFAASRLLGSVFGTSNLVWASIIGLILIYLTLGYSLGGRWADRSPEFKTMYLIMAWGAFSAGLVPLVAHPVLRLAAQAFDALQVGVLLGSFSAVLVLFCVPVTLLGTISPFAIRLGVRHTQEAGRVSGRVYAISTLGSFLGTFLPVLVTIPLWGTTNTFLLFSVFLVGVALIGLLLSGERRTALMLTWMPLVLMVIFLHLGQQRLKSTSGQIYETESAYNYIEVLEVNGYRLLRLNEGQGVHSMWHPTQLDFSGPWEQFLAAPFFNPAPYKPENVQDIAIIGLAAGTVAKQATAVFGPVPIDGFEIDAEIIRVGREFFDMRAPNLNAIAQDGRLGLALSRKRYSLIIVDAYRPPYIPWHLTTREFFEIVKSHLREDGTLAINVGRSPEDRRLVDGLAGTLRAVFPSVFAMDVPNTFNSVLYATNFRADFQNLYDNLLYLHVRGDIHPLLLKSIESTIIHRRSVPVSAIVFTDDHAPIEWITNTMVLNYVLFGELSTIQGVPK